MITRKQVDTLITVAIVLAVIGLIAFAMLRGSVE